MFIWKKDGREKEREGIFLRIHFIVNLRRKNFLNCILSSNFFLPVFYSSTFPHFFPLSLFFFLPLSSSFCSSYSNKTRVLDEMKRKSNKMNDWTYLSFSSILLLLGFLNSLYYNFLFLLFSSKFSATTL